MYGIRMLTFENPREKSRDARITLKIGPNGVYLDFFVARIFKFQNSDSVDEPQMHLCDGKRALGCPLDDLREELRFVGDVFFGFGTPIYVRYVPDTGT